MIPIIHKNYAGLMAPPLIHLENAILYENLEDLVEKIQYAFKLDEEKILEMRKAVQTYYNRNLTPSNVVQTIISNKEAFFLLQAEQNSIKEIL